MYMTATKLQEMGSNSNTRRIKAEQAIVRKHLKRVIAAGYSVKVFDGEEMSPKFTTAKDAWAFLGETDEDRLYVYTQGGQRIGSILFIWGNDEDILSDWGWNDDLEGSQAVMDKLCA